MHRKSTFGMGVRNGLEDYAAIWQKFGLKVLISIPTSALPPTILRSLILEPNRFRLNSTSSLSVCRRRCCVALTVRLKDFIISNPEHLADSSRLRSKSSPMPSITGQDWDYCTIPSVAAAAFPRERLWTRWRLPIPMEVRRL
jgi:hypothetical protein